jgi:transcriptional regulator with XRE-family HTH domain
VTSPDGDPAGDGSPIGRADEAATGLRVREFRLLRGFSVRKLAVAAGLSPSFISQIENGQTNPSVRSLLRICGVLRINLGDIFTDQGEGDRPVLKSWARPVLRGGEGAKKFLLTRKPIRHLEVYQLELEPGGETGPPETYGDSQALLLVTRGVATFLLGDREEILEEDDSIEFQTSVPHSVANRGDRRLVVVITLKATTPTAAPNI